MPIRRATNRLVPLMPTDPEEELPRPRRSPRHEEPRHALLTKCLLTWFALITGANAFLIQPLPPGIHVLPLRNLSIKALDLEFTLNTNLNLTEDQQTLERQMGQLKEFGDLLNTTDFAAILKHCYNVHEEIQDNTKELMKEIHNSYAHSNISGDVNGYHTFSRTRRGVPIAILAVAKAAIRFSPEILMGVGVIYQAHVNNKLETQNEILKEELKRTVGLTLNLMHAEFAIVKHELQQITDQQVHIKMEEKINDYIAVIQLTSTAILSNHQNLGNIRPIQELKLEVARLNEKRMMFELPEDTQLDKILARNSFKKTLQNGMARITFRVPLVKPEKFMEYVIISAPTAENHVITLITEGFCV